jgi:hexosaminidase
MQNIAAQFNNQSTVYAVNNEVSVGGDEVSSHAWTNDTSCRNEWGNLSALEKSHLFFQKLANSNSELMFSGWQQFIQNDSESLGKNIVAANQTGHVWVWNPSSEGVGQAVSLANNNYPTVLAYADKTYFDLAYTPSMYEPGFTWATAYSDTYSNLSMAETASKTQSKTKNPQNIVGIEGTLWSENLPSFDHLMYMALPKMPGLAEAGWSPNWVTINNKQLDWQSLATRLGCGETGFLAYLNQSFGVNYRGYPHGISRELADDNSLCSTSSSMAN